jgi:hypothetical protein
MKTPLAAFLLTFLVAFGHAGTDARSRQEDRFLTAYYTNEVVLCRDYETANGARLATYQWWLLGFVSGASYVSDARPTAPVDVKRVLALASEHCQAKPTDTLAAAAVAVLTTLRPKR